MQDLSLHVLDIAENSAHADATLIEIEIIEDSKKDCLSIQIKDNGRGMDDEILKRVMNPFYTTRTTRRVGLGIPLLKQNCELAGGTLTLKSELNKGTLLLATMQLSHIDRLPIGDMASTMITLINAYPTIDWVYTYQKDNQIAEVDTREMKAILGDVSLEEPEIMQWIQDYIKDQHEFV